MDVHPDQVEGDGVALTRLGPADEVVAPARPDDHAVLQVADAAAANLVALDDLSRPADRDSDLVARDDVARTCPSATDQRFLGAGQEDAIAIRESRSTRCIEADGIAQYAA